MTTLEQQNFTQKKYDFIQEVILINNVAGSLLTAVIFSGLNGLSFFMSVLTTFMIFGFYSLIFCIPSAGILGYSITFLKDENYSSLKKTILMLVPQLMYLVLIVFYFQPSPLAICILLCTFSCPFIFWTFRKNFWDVDLEKIRSNDEFDDVLDKF